MSDGADRVPILVVDDDEVLGRVLSRVLTREGYNVTLATTPDQAVAVAGQATPALALLDLCLPDGDGVTLAHALRARHPRLPLILMTAYPMRLRDQPELTKPFSRVLTKPLNLTELRETLDTVLHESTESEPMNPSSKPQSPQAVPSEAALRPAAAPLPTPPHTPTPVMQSSGSSNHLSSAIVPVLALLVLVLFGAYVAGVPLPGVNSAYVEKTIKAEAPPAVKLVEAADKKPTHTVRVPEDVRVALGIRKAGQDAIATAAVPKGTRPLVLSGSTALDPTRIFRIRARFSARVVEIAKRTESNPKTGMTEERELRANDPVKKGDLLGVFQSADVGQKKNDLIDALVQQKLDQAVLDKAEARSDAIPEVFLLNARRNVEADKNAISRAVNNLKTWDIPEEDIQAVFKEADEIGKRGGKRDRTKDDLWPRVELRAPADGTILERNVSRDELVVDNTVNLFTLAATDRMLVVANAQEDDLPTLLSLPNSKRRWTLKAVGGFSVEGTIDDIGYLIDVNQHSAVIKGHIDNPRDRDNPAGRLRASQFVSATIDLPAPDDVVEVPVSSVVDDGKQTVVFVQADPSKNEYTLRRVVVTHRFEKSLFVKSALSDGERKLSPEDAEAGLLARQPLKVGERVLTNGVLELKKELEDRESGIGSK